MSWFVWWRFGPSPLTMNSAFVCVFIIYSDGPPPGPTQPILQRYPSAPWPVYATRSNQVRLPLSRSNKTTLFWPIMKIRLVLATRAPTPTLDLANHSFHLKPSHSCAPDLWFRFKQHVKYLDHWITHVSCELLNNLVDLMINYLNLVDQLLKLEGIT